MKVAHTTAGAVALAATAMSQSCPTVNTDVVNVPKLPDPFTFSGGSIVSTQNDWSCRRDEIKKLLDIYELGTFPPKPDSVTGSLVNGTMTINVTNGDKSISFSPKVTLPANATGPVPALIAYGGVSIPLPAGVALITYSNDDIAQQNSGSSRGIGKFFTLFGANATAGATTAWAWGVSRIIDVLEANPSFGINPKKVAVTGCSRNGKGALIAGALEDRIALTIAQESGSGGSACWRISDAYLANNISIQTASEIVQENVWYSTNFNPYVNSITTLPFDHHMLAALIAPRGLYATDNNIDW
ncbi:hypothetical protein HDV00_002193 [Rhizophlyctis rosea]|nr:hypothetical protein HDV00_002193 [Rhizophlyctis rosea]